MWKFFCCCSRVKKSTPSVILWNELDDIEKQLAAHDSGEKTLSVAQEILLCTLRDAIREELKQKFPALKNPRMIDYSTYKNNFN